METSLRWEGWYEIFLFNSRGKLKFYQQIKNVILDLGLDTIGFFGYNPDLLCRYAAVGTSNTAAATTDTGLIAELALANTPRTKYDGGVVDSLAYVAGPPPYWSFKRSRQWNPGQATATLNEIGMCMFNRTAFSPGPGGTNDPFWSRQVFGPVNKLAGDTLRIVYELRMYPPNADVVDVVTVDGVSRNFTTRGYLINNSATWGKMTYNFPGDQLVVPDDIVVGDPMPSTGFHSFGDQRGKEDSTLLGNTVEDGAFPNSNFQEINKVGLAGYASGNFYSDVRNTWDTIQLVFGTGVGLLYTAPYFTGTGPAFCFQTSISPKITKSDTFKLTIDLRISWGRYP